MLSQCVSRESASLTLESTSAFVSMFDAFERSTDSHLFFAYDGHFTPNGHRLAASVLRDHLVARALALVER